jgi:hypothetical protein
MSLISRTVESLQGVQLFKVRKVTKLYALEVVKKL